MTCDWLAPFPRLLQAIQSYPRLSKAIQGYPRHQKMHGEAPRHQSEETNCGIIRCVNPHSNRSCSARARNGLTRYHFGTDFRPHSSEATIKWQGVWFTEPSNHTFRPPFKLVSKNQIYINLYKWGRIASGHSPTEKKKCPLLGQRPSSRRRSRRLQAAEHICWYVHSVSSRDQSLGLAHRLISIE